MHDPVAAIDVARRALPGATVISYPQATHALVGEQPAHIARDVGAFVAEVDR